MICVGLGTLFGFWRQILLNSILPKMISISCSCFGKLRYMFIYFKWRSPFAHKICGKGCPNSNDSNFPFLFLPF